MKGTAINQAAARKDPLDRYYTPDRIAYAHLRYLRLPPEWDVHDPCAGDGAYLRAAEKRGHGWSGSDIDPGAAHIARADMRDGIRLPYSGLGFALVTNPPFRGIEEWIPLMLHSEAPVVSLLLPISALEPTRKRAPIWRETPPDAIAYIGRVRFVGPHLDGKRAAAMSYAWVTWGTTHLPAMSWPRVDLLAGGAA